MWFHFGKRFIHTNIDLNLTHTFNQMNLTEIGFCFLFCFFHSLLLNSGLKKFLAQYPAIFVIDGDHVLVNSFEKSASNDMLGGGTRDYIQESKDYFKHKLLQYGIGTEVPIKSLLGHRSQASPQIRHISGENYCFSPYLPHLNKH